MDKAQASWGVAAKAPRKQRRTAGGRGTRTG